MLSKAWAWIILRLWSSFYRRTDKLDKDFIERIEKKKTQEEEKGVIKENQKKSKLKRRRKGNQKEVLIQLVSFKQKKT